MKKTKTIYWIVTGLFCAFMLFSAIPDIMVTPEAVTFITSLGYPKYFIPFIGVAKLLGVIAILVPGFPNVKEWAYAGFGITFISATIAHISSGDPLSVAIMPLVFLAVLVISNVYLYKKQKTAAVSFKPSIA